MKKFTWIAAASLGALAVPAAATAQTAPATAQASGAKVGDIVYDGAGAEVGKIESIDNGVAVINTGVNRASVPVSSFGVGEKGPSFGMTKAQLDEAAATAANAAQSEIRSKLTAGAPVRGNDGNVVASVKAVDGDAVALTSAKGDVTVPITGIGTDDQGLVIGMSQAQFEAAVVAAQTN